MAGVELAWNKQRLFVVINGYWQSPKMGPGQPVHGKPLAGELSSDIS